MISGIQTNMMNCKNIKHMDAALLCGIALMHEFRKDLLTFMKHQRISNNMDTVMVSFAEK